MVRAADPRGHKPPKSPDLLAQGIENTMCLNNFSEVFQSLHISLSEASISVVNLSQKMADNWERKAAALRWRVPVSANPKRSDPKHVCSRNM